jgi:hypothetical protein
MSMNPILRFLICFLISGIALLSGCKEPQESFRKTVSLPSITVHVMNEYEMTREVLKRGYPQQWLGFTTENEIYTRGKMVNGKIVPEQTILGHELAHQLQMKYPEIFANPDN